MQIFRQSVGSILVSLVFCTLAYPQAQAVTGASSTEVGRLPLPQLPQLPANHDWAALSQRLGDDHGPDASFWREILWSKQRRYADSLRELEPMLSQIASKTDRDKEKQARLATTWHCFATKTPPRNTLPSNSAALPG